MMMVDPTGRVNNAAATPLSAGAVASMRATRPTASKDMPLPIEPLHATITMILAGISRNEDASAPGRGRAADDGSLANAWDPRYPKELVPGV